MGEAAARVRSDNGAGEKRIFVHCRCKDLLN